MNAKDLSLLELLEEVKNIWIFEEGNGRTDPASDNYNLEIDNGYRCLLAAIERVKGQNG